MMSPLYPWNNQISDLPASFPLVNHLTLFEFIIPSCIKGCIHQFDWMSPTDSEEHLLSQLFDSMEYGTQFQFVFLNQLCIPLCEFSIHCLLEILNLSVLLYIIATMCQYLFPNLVVLECTLQRLQLLRIGSLLIIAVAQLAYSI